MYSTGYSCQILMKLEFSRLIFEKSSNITFHENPSIWELRCSILTDGHDEASGPFLQFCERS